MDKKKMLPVIIGGVILVAVIVLMIANPSVKKPAGTDPAAAATTSATETDSRALAVLDANYDAITEIADEAPGLPASFGEVTELASYTGREVKKGEVLEISDLDAEYVIADYREQDAVIEYIDDRPAQLFDIVNIDYKGTENGVAFDGGTAQGADLELGSGTFIDGFEDGIVGMNIGDTKTLTLTFPEDYRAAELAGHTVQFDVKVNDIKKNNIPGLTDEWVKEHTGGEFTDVESYKQYVKERTQRRLNLNAEYNAGREIVTAVTAESQVTPSVEGIHYIYDSNYRLYQDRAVSQGMSLKYYLEQSGQNYDDFCRRLAEYSATTVEQLAVMDAIFQAEGMELTDQDRSDMAVVMGAENDDAVETYGQDWLDLNARSTKVLLFLAANAVSPKEE